MLYVTGVVTAFIIYAADRAGLIPRYLPFSELSFSTRLLLSSGATFIIVRFFLWWLDELFDFSESGGPLARMTTGHGVSRVFDLLILLLVLVSLFFAVGSETITPYLIGVATLAVIGALESIAREVEFGDRISAAVRRGNRRRVLAQAGDEDS